MYKLFYKFKECTIYFLTFKQRTIYILLKGMYTLLLTMGVDSLPENDCRPMLEKSENLKRRKIEFASLSKSMQYCRFVFEFYLKTNKSINI